LGINTLSISVFLPLIVGFVVLLLPNALRTLSKAITLVVSIGAFGLAIATYSSADSDYIRPLLQIGDLKLDLMLTATPLGSFILMFAMLFGLLIVIYSFKSMAGAERLNEYYGAILLTIGGSAGILLSNHLLFLLIFWEIVTVSLYLMITTGGRNCSFAATKTFVMIGASDAAFLLGVLMVWKLSGTFVISDISLATSGSLAIIAFLLLLAAAITKAGSMPLHTWLPTSGEYAPPSVMALLPAAIDKLLGIYLLVLVVREIFVLESKYLSIVLAIIGAATVIIAVMIAMVQHNLKRLLSYHAISQVGYMILGIATMTPVGIAGGVFHMLNHAIYKCCLFLCGGAVEHATGTADLDRLGGLGKKMPITFITCLVAALSISGIPPLNGFVSKWMVYQGLIQMDAAQTGVAAGLWPVWLVAAMFGSALTLASFVKLIHSVFLSRKPDALKGVKEVSPLMFAPALVLAFLCVFFGIFYYVPLKAFIYPALGIETDAAILSTWTPGLATILMLVGIGIGLLILVVGGLLARKIRIVPTWTCGEIQPNDQMIIPGTHFYKTVSRMAGHCGILPAYLTWITIGLLILLFVMCGIW